MPITIDGTGSISGLSAGGLPDLSVDSADIADSAVTTTKVASQAITTGKIANDAITAAKLDGGQSGSAPIYGARAWVNFNGTGTIAIRSSGNVSSLTDNAVGRYSVNFTTAMSNANYAVACVGTRSTGWSSNVDDAIAPTTAAVSVTTNNGSGNADSTYVCVTVTG
jgi:hypothetical protein